MLQSKDSVFVKGVVSDENGSFILNTPHQNGIVKVTCIGYRTVFLNVTDDNLGVIVLNYYYKRAEKIWKRKTNLYLCNN